MIKLDISIAEDMPSFPQVNFSTSLENPHSTGDENVLADLEHLWGENRDCFESLLNTTGTTTTTSDCDSCDDYSDSSVTRFSTKPLVSKLAPIGETFGRNHINTESSVSNALSMVSAGQYLNAGDDDIFNSSSPDPKIEPDLLITETSNSQNEDCLRHKQLEVFENCSGNFEKPDYHSLIRSNTTSPATSESDFQPLNYSLKDPYPSLQLPTSTKQQSGAKGHRIQIYSS